MAGGQLWIERQVRLIEEDIMGDKLLNFGKKISALFYNFTYELWDNKIPLATTFPIS